MFFLCFLRLPNVLLRQSLESREMILMRSGNYCAFYVAEPFNPSALGAHATKDFCYFNLLRSWKGGDSSYPFVDSHATTYSVRDGSDWETTLKPRLRARLRASQNVIFFLSSDTVNSRALREELDYAINDQQLPVLVIYPEYATKESLLNNGSLKNEIRALWSKVPIFQSSIEAVPTLHLPLKKDLIKLALNDANFKFATKKAAGVSRYSA